MRQPIVLTRFVLVLSLLFAFSANAQNTGSSDDRRDAQAWLKKIQSAAQKLNYSGTFVYQQGNQIRTSRITHLLNGNSEAEKLEILDGQAREYIRKDDEVICYLPDSKTMFVEKRVTHDVFPAILAASPSELKQFYQISKGEGGRVAGQDCQSVVLEPKDNLRYGYKLWADRSSGLLLRAQTLNEKNEVVEQISFTQISIGNVFPRQTKASFANTGGWRVENALMSEVTDSGWTVKSPPPGFKKIREVKRLVSDNAASDKSTTVNSAREVLQMVFSDGLAAISVFIEPGSQSRTEGSLRQGALNIIGKRYSDYWLTIVGEVPLAAIKQVANSIELKSKQ